MAETWADEGWAVFVRGEASGPAVYLVGLATDRESEDAVRAHYTNETVKVEQPVRLTKENVVGFKLRKGEMRRGNDRQAPKTPARPCPTRQAHDRHRERREA
jgi:hypothetical protein